MVEQITDNNNKEIKYKHYNSRKNYIFGILKRDGLWSINEIRKELNSQNPKISISLEGIRKHLAEMKEKKEVIRVKIPKSKRYFDYYSRIYPQSKLNRYTSDYYIHLPFTYDFSNSLNRQVSKFKDPNKYNELVNKIVNKYETLELEYNATKHKLSDKKTLEKALKEFNKTQKKKIRLTKKISLMRNYFDKTFDNFAELEIKHYKSIPFVIVDKKEYFYVNDELIPLDKLIRFAAYIKITPGMVNLGKGKLLFSEIFQLMEELFIRMVKDTQFKF